MMVTSHINYPTIIPLLLCIFGIFCVEKVGATRSTTFTHPSVDLSSESNPSIGSLEVCDHKETDEWFSRITLNEDMVDPVMTYRYCYYAVTRTRTGDCQTCFASYCYENDYYTLSFSDELVCGENVFTKKLRDKEVFRAFYDDYSNDSPDHSAVGYSDAGTVCFYHYQQNFVQGTAQRCGAEGGRGSCEVTCLGLDGEGEKHSVVLRDYDRGKEPYWFVEVSFSKKQSSSTFPGADGSTNSEGFRGNFLPSMTVFVVGLLTFVL